jgi:hypothetical protein
MDKVVSTAPARDEIRSGAFAAAAIALMVGAIWLPFGGNVGPTQDEWRILDLIVSGEPMVPAHHPLHVLRPFIFVPNLIAFRLTPDSFVGMNVVIALSMFLKGMLLYVLIRQLVPNRPPGLAFLSGALFALYPAYAMAFWGAAMAAHCGHVLFLLALTSFLAWRTSRRIGFLAAAWAALFATSGIVENVYPFVLLVPALFLVGGPTSRRRVLIDTALWLAVPLAFMTRYVTTAVASVGSYQGTLFAMPTVSQVLVSLARAYGYGIFGGWGPGVALDCDPRCTLVCTAVGLIVGTTAFVLWCGRHTPCAVVLPARGLLVLGNLTVAVGFLPYLVTALRDSVTWTMGYCSLGAALLWAGGVDTLAEHLGRRRLLFAALSALLMGVASSKALAQHRQFRDWARDQQVVLRPLVRELSGVRENVVVILLDYEDRFVPGIYPTFAPGTHPRFAPGVLESALRYLLNSRSLRVLLWEGECSPESTGVRVLPPSRQGWRRDAPFRVPYQQIVVIRFEPDGTPVILPRLPQRWNVPAPVAANYRPWTLLDGPKGSERRIDQALER